MPESLRDDLVSAGFFGLLKALQNRRPDAHDFELSAYVSRRIDGAVVDEARGWIGRAARTSSVDPWLLDGGGVGDDAGGDVLARCDHEDPETSTARVGRWARVDRCLDQVDPEVRAILMGIAAGASVAEIARAEGRSAGQIQARLARGIRQLKGRAPELRRLLREDP